MFLNCSYINFIAKNYIAVFSPVYILEENNTDHI